MSRIRGIGTAQHARRRAIRPLSNILPTSYAGQQQWLRGDLGFTVVSNDLSALDDQFSSGNDMIQPVSIDRPEYTGITLGGQQAWDMDGSEHLEEALPSLGTSAAKFTVILVVHPISVATGANTHFLRDIGGLLIRLTDTSNEISIVDSGGAKSFGVNPVAEEQILSFQLNGATAKLRKNGTEIGSSISYADTDWNGDYGLGANYGGSAGMVGKMAEVVVYSPPLLDADLAQLTSSYFQPRYGL